jgi:hypothetical protein
MSNCARPEQSAAGFRVLEPLMADLPPELAKAASGLIGPAIGAAAGALMRHSQLAQAGQRKFWSLHLVYEFPTVVGMSVIGGGLAQYLGLPELAAWSLCGVMSFYGPKAVDTVLAVAAKRAGLSAPVETKAR